MNIYFIINDIYESNLLNSEINNSFGIDFFA